MAISLKNKLFDYFAQLHFDLMKPEVRACFDAYANNNDFRGHMKEWNTRYVGQVLPDLLNAPAGGTNDHQLTDAEWEELFDAFQQTFQSMDLIKKPSVGFAGPYKSATLDFIKDYFGDSYKPFTKTQATDDTKNVFARLHAFLLTNRNALEMPFKQHLSSLFADGYTYDKLLTDLSAQKYDSDLEFRKKVKDIVEYIQYYQTYPDYEHLPTAAPVGTGAPVLADLTGLDPNPKKWYEIKNKSRHINQFKSDYSFIFGRLLTNPGVRSDFLAKAPDTIAEPLSKAIEQTDYENKDSKDFLEPKYPDKKNWVQQIEDSAKDKYEDYLRKFVNPSRGTRIFFSAPAQNIIKAFDKVNIKPTDGVNGILAKKDDINKKLADNVSATDHFKWFTETIGILKSSMPNAVEGALRNAGQMQNLVSGIIAEACKKGKIKEAKTALEILSVAKYGLLSSRTFDAVRKATKEAKIFSDEKLSWNKNEGIQSLTNVVDSAGRIIVNGFAAGVTIIRNAVNNSRTKIGKDIRNNTILRNDYLQWQNKDQSDYQTLQAENNRMNVDMKLATLATGHGLSGRIIANDTDLANAETALAGMAPGAAYDDLRADIDLYKDAKERKDHEINWHNEHKDNYKELISYWDLLETCAKSHAFTLGSMSARRRAELLNAQNTHNAYRNQHFQTLRAA